MQHIPQYQFRINEFQSTFNVKTVENIIMGMQQILKTI